MEDQLRQKELIAYLEGFVSERRRLRLQEVLAQRTRHMTLVLEDVYQAHNASAVLRSADCFGIQDTHFIENRNRYKISEDVAMGASQWLTLNRYTKTENNTLSCLKELKEKGYRIVATTPHKDDKLVSELDVNTPFALVFGTEITGISQDVFDVADEFVKIQMHGFTESFNISVCASLCMYELSNKIRREVPNYGLTQAEKDSLYVDWLKASIRKSDLVVKAFDQDKTA